MAFDYSNYDYDALVAEATRLISNKGTWTDTYQSSTGQVLIQLIAALTDNLAYMLERRTQENFLPTAELRSSVGALANLLGYRPQRRVSSNGTLQLALVDDAGNPIGSEGTVTLTKYDVITYDVYNFVVSEDYTLPSTTTYPVSIKVKEGIVKTLTYDPTDISGTLFNDNYILITDYENIEETSLNIFTSTQTFYDVREEVGGNPALEALTFAAPTDNAYDVRITNDGLRIIFGDGTYGAKPAGTLTIEYIESSGVDVSIIDTGLDFAFETDTLGDDVIKVPLNAYKYTLTNAAAIDGGLEAETIAVTKNRAPDYVRTAARAVTKHDYEFWAKRSVIGGIVDAEVYGEEEKGIDVLNMNNVYIVYLNDTGTVFTPTEQQDFRDFMDVYKNITSHLVLVQAENIPLQINMTVKRSNVLTASNSEVYTFLRQDLIDLFALQEGSLGKDVYHSELVDRYHSLTMTKDGEPKRIADYVKIDIKSLLAFSTPLVTQSTTSTITWVNGDTYRITINGTDYDYVAGGGDTDDTTATALAALVTVHSAVTASATLNVISIDTVSAGTTFTVTNIGSTNQLNNRIDLSLQLPVSMLNNTDLSQLFLPSSIDVIDTSGTIIATDNGSGVLYNGTVDYVTGEVVIPIQSGLPNGSYYLRYEQDTKQNFNTNPRQSLTFSTPKVNYSDVTELLSTIVFE